MGWYYDQSIERIHKHLDGMGEIEIGQLARDADLDQLLSETCCREIWGAHVYIQVSNFSRLISHTAEDPDAYKRLIRSIHIYQREVARIIEGTDIFDGLRIHFQGSKVHALFYRPINDSRELATRAVLLQLVLRDFSRAVFNLAFPDYNDFAIAGGADIGSAIGTRNGMNGDRELLFLGAPANYAAKILTTSDRLRLTTNIYNALADDLQEICAPVKEGLYQIEQIGYAKLDALLRVHDIKWDRETSANRIKNDKEQFPLKDIAYSSAEALINLDDLSICNNKQVLAASIFADISGFTRYIDAARREGELRTALRVFHVIRKELARVLKNDFKGLRVQFQGDRVQGLFHLPKDDKAAIATKAIEAAAGLQSSIELTIKACLPETDQLKLAVGIDIGTTFVSKLGTRAHRDRICLGEAVEQAAACEERCEGGQIGITEQVYEVLPPHLGEHFTYDARRQCYVANELTMEKVERADKGVQRYRADAPVFLRSAATGVTITNQESPRARSISSTRPYAP